MTDEAIHDESMPEPTPKAIRRFMPRITRRRVLKTFAAGVVASFGTYGWATTIEPHWVEIVERPLPLAGLPKSLAGKRLIQVSDLHVGETEIDYLVKAFRSIGEIRPDMIAITGDFVDRDYAAVQTDLAQVFAALPAAPLGAFACLGNHDYRSGHAWRNLGLADRVTATAAAAGVRVLRDEHVDVEGLSIVGLDDLWSPRFEGSRSLDRLDHSRDALCLAHNPDTCDFGIWGTFRGTTLSGHTHGGQCKPPFLPPPLLPVRNRRYIAGPYDITPTRRLYVNRGIGHTLKARFNCRPEITAFTLIRT